MPESLVAGQLYSAGESACAHELDHVARDELDRARVRGESILLAAPACRLSGTKGSGDWVPNALASPLGFTATRRQEISRNRVSSSQAA